MTEMVHWTEISIGYESLRADASSKLHENLKAWLKPEHLLRWTTGDMTEVTSKDDGDKWVAEALTKEIKKALKDASVQVVARDNDDLLRADVNEYNPKFMPPAAADAKAKYTRCVMIGGKWFNKRTYRLTIKDQELPFGTQDHNASDYIFATMTWPCEEH